MASVFQKRLDELKDFLLEKTVVKLLVRLGIKKKKAELVGVAFYSLLGLLTILTSYLPRISGKSNGDTLPLETKQPSIEKEEVIEAPTCPSGADFCSDFKDGKWEGKEDFEIAHEDLEIFQLLTNEEIEGRIMFFKEEIYPSFVAVLEVIPLSEEFNIVFQYGNYYRCIFGDGNNQTVGCQINNSWPHSSPSDWRYIDLSGNVLPKGGRWHFYMDGDVEGSTPLMIRFEQIPTENSRDVKIKIRVTFFPVSSSTSVEREIEYTLTLKTLSSEIRDRIGVGLIDPKKTDKIQASFQYFEVDERPLD